MYRFGLIAIMIVFVTLVASAQNKSAGFEFNKDRFLLGSTVVHDTAGMDDLFMTGGTVRNEQDITGSAHLAGRKVISNGAIGGNAYLAGMEVSIDGKIAGDATVGGYTIQIGEVDGDLRATGDTLTLSGPVSGYALVSGDKVTFNSVVKGDVSLAAQEVNFADDARIEGKLIVYEEKTGEIDVPAQVIPQDRIERRDISEWPEAGREAETKSWLSKLVSFLRRVLFIAVMASLIAAARPQKLAVLRQSILDHPLRNLLFGFLAVSAGLGAAILLMFTGLGFLLVLASVLIALLGAFTGYVIGTYAIGVKTLLWTKRPEPDAIGGRILAAGIGAFTVSIIAMIPYLGWLFVLAVALIGAGALYVRLFRPTLLVMA